MRRKYPIDAEHVTVQPGEFVLTARGQVFRVLGWYMTSFSSEVIEWRYVRGRWVEGKPSMRPVEVDLKVKLKDVPTTEEERKRAFRQRYAGKASEISRKQIAEHRAIVRKLKLPRDDV